MDKVDLQIEIRPLEEIEIETFESEFPEDARSGHHRKRFHKQQKGEGLYLVAWHYDKPIGHFLLHWSGPDNEHVRKHNDISKTAYLEGGRTKEAFRRKGVATQVINKAEQLALEHGCTGIGLEVGSNDNPDAKRLYEKLGYTDWEHGEFTINWEDVHPDGSKSTESEVVTYMHKDL